MLIAFYLRKYSTGNKSGFRFKVNQLLN